MSERFDREVAELALWYHHNLRRIPPENLKKRCEFLEITCDTLIKLFLNTAVDMKRLEGRNMLDRLWIPPGVVNRRIPLVELMQEGEQYVSPSQD